MAAQTGSGRGVRAADPHRNTRELRRALRALQPVIDRFVEAATDDSAERGLALLLASHGGEEPSSRG